MLRDHVFSTFYLCNLTETNNSPLKMDCWKIKVPLEKDVVQGLWLLVWGNVNSKKVLGFFQASQKNHQDTHARWMVAARWINKNSIHLIFVTPHSHTTPIPFPIQNPLSPMGCLYGSSLPVSGVPELQATPAPVPNAQRRRFPSSEDLVVKDVYFLENWQTHPKKFDPEKWESHSEWWFQNCLCVSGV